MNGKSHNGSNLALILGNPAIINACKTGIPGRPEAQNQIQAAMQHGLPTRDAEFALAQMLGKLPDPDKSAWR